MGNCPEGGCDKIKDIDKAVFGEHQDGLTYKIDKKQDKIMPDNLLQTGGAGGIGAIIGTFLGFLGLKGRIDSLEKRIVGQATCEIVQKNYNDLFRNQNDMLREIRADIKSILKNGNGNGNGANRWNKP